MVYSASRPMIAGIGPSPPVTLIRKSGRGWMDRFKSYFYFYTAVKHVVGRHYLDTVINKILWIF